MKQLLLCSIVFVAVASPSCLATDQCSRSEAASADSAIDHLDSWDNVYHFFKQYGHCYDASIAEGVDDKIQLLWADHWENLHRMLELTTKDPKFKAFIWQRMSDQDFPADTHARILLKAKSSCPTGASEFCRTFVATAAGRKPN